MAYAEEGFAIPQPEQANALAVDVEMAEEMRKRVDHAVKQIEHHAREEHGHQIERQRWERIAKAAHAAVEQLDGPKRPEYDDGPHAAMSAFPDHPR